MNNEWTKEEDEVLLSMIKQKKTARQIADCLNRTRDAVIGRARRIGTNFGGMKAHERVKKEPLLKTAFRFIIKKVFSYKDPDPLAIVQSLETKNILIWSLTDKTCRWPVGGEKEHTEFCGLEPVKGKPYCSNHCDIAYARPSR
jgi:GcrA cell cycle regulator